MNPNAPSIDIVMDLRSSVLQRLQEAYQLVHQNIKQGQHCQAQQYDASRQVHTFQPGDFDMKSASTKRTHTKVTLAMAWTL